VTSAGRRTSSFEFSMRCWERCWEIASPGTEVPDDREMDGNGRMSGENLEIE